MFRKFELGGCCCRRCYSQLQEQATWLNFVNSQHQALVHVQGYSLCGPFLSVIHLITMEKISHHLE